MADFVVVPIYAGAAIATAFIEGKPGAIHAFSAIAGYFSWTLTEYAMHRWGFHRLYRRDHARHHVRPLEWIGVTPWLSAAALAVIWALLVAALGPAAGSVSFTGYAVGYYAYIVVHWMIHHSSRRIIAPLKTHHDLHHRRAGSNFGVSTRLWDVVFRTRA